MLNKHSGSGTIKPDYQLANELHEPIIKKFRKRKLFSSYRDDKWPEHISQELRPHFTTRNELSIDIIIRGLRIVIPSCTTTRFYLNFTRITRVCQEWYRWADYIFGFWTLIKKSKSLLKLVKPTKNYQTPQTKACHTLGIGPFSLWIVFTLIYLSSKKNFVWQWWIVTVNGSKLTLPIPGRQWIPLKHQNFGFPIGYTEAVSIRQWSTVHFYLI